MIEVNFKQSIFLILCALIFAQQGLLKLIVGIFIDLLFPENEFGLFIILDNPEDISMKPLNIFVFFSFCDSVSESFQFLERLVDSILQSFTPGECTCNWRVIVVDWRPLIILFNKNLALQENRLNVLQVKLVHIKENSVFLLEFVLNDWSIQYSLKAV